jgi:hypothetical protein
MGDGFGGGEEEMGGVELEGTNEGLGREMRRRRTDTVKWIVVVVVGRGSYLLTPTPTTISTNSLPHSHLLFSHPL